ncbi:hypothetical protein F4774DRAFT_409934 [Daldinia eschscholtzii]|nr:hypothetical protein F4774DRAFT_409934 [Daldinia eschscholtzii]
MAGGGWGEEGERFRARPHFGAARYPRDPSYTSPPIATPVRIATRHGLICIYCLSVVLPPFLPHRKKTYEGPTNLTLTTSAWMRLERAEEEEAVAEQSKAKQSSADVILAVYAPSNATAYCQRSAKIAKKKVDRPATLLAFAQNSDDVDGARPQGANFAEGRYEIRRKNLA